MWNEQSFVASSTHRQKVLSVLWSGPTSVSKIAEATGLKLPHVSKALSDLQEKGLVKCLTPRSRKGRIYSLTKNGREISSKESSLRKWMSIELESKITQALDNEKLSYAKRFRLNGAIFSPTIDFVTFAGQSPKMAIMLISITTDNASSPGQTAYSASDLKKKTKDLKVVLVVGGTSRNETPEVLKFKSTFDKIFFWDEIGELVDYVKINTLYAPMPEGRHLPKGKPLKKQQTLQQAIQKSKDQEVNARK